jgi:hypothetical protein
MSVDATLAWIPTVTLGVNVEPGAAGRSVACD